MQPTSESLQGEWPVTLSAVELILHFESFYPKPYNDLLPPRSKDFYLPDNPADWYAALKVAGLTRPATATIGYGETDDQVVKSYAGRHMPVSVAGQYLAKRLSMHLRNVMSVVHVPLNSNQIGAFVSLAYNIGDANFASSTLVKKLNQGDYQGAADQFLVWNKAAGKVLRGLERRRKAERDLFMVPGNMKPVWSYPSGNIALERIVEANTPPRSDLSQSRTIQSVSKGGSAVTVGGGLIALETANRVAAQTDMLSSTVSNMGSVAFAIVGCVAVFFALRHFGLIKFARIDDNKRGLR